jgi:hypothetical protein
MKSEKVYAQYAGERNTVEASSVIYYGMYKISACCFFVLCELHLVAGIVFQCS